MAEIKELKQGQQKIEKGLGNLEQKLDQNLVSHEERIEQLEGLTGIHKN